MKRLLLCLGFLAAFNFGRAQLPVSTAPENKNVVLEEYTGIYCVFCPDGHRIASNLKSSNPQDVVLLNIHTGSFAAPNGNDPDFRTFVGTYMASGTGIAGYPAGSVNRRVFTGLGQREDGMAMSRSNWTTAAGDILAESSYVNIAAEALYDLATDEIKVDIEIYFTGNQQSATPVKLYVALLQNNVPGPQTGANNNPSQVLPNGSYNHMHMLRDLMSSRFGDDIDTSNGKLVRMTYTYPLPADIDGVATNPQDMEVVAFVAEGAAPIITGTTASYVVGNVSVPEFDAQLVDLRVYPNPTANKLIVSLETEEDNQANIEVLDYSGKLMKTIPDFSLLKGQNEIEVAVNNLESGVYLLKLNIDGRSVTEKFMVK